MIELTWNTPWLVLVHYSKVYFFCPFFFVVYLLVHALPSTTMTLPYGHAFRQAVRKWQAKRRLRVNKARRRLLSRNADLAQVRRWHKANPLRLKPVWKYK